MDKPKLVIASACAAAAAILLTSALTVLAELSGPLKDWLKNFSGHHWTSKSLLSALFYAAATLGLYALPFKYSDALARRALTWLLWCALLGVIAVGLFFTGHHLGRW